MKLGVVGAGAMGQGIAQVAIAAGIEVKLFDVAPDAVPQASARILERISSQVRKGRIAEEAFAAIGKRLASLTTLGELADCEIVVEAVFEKLELKRQLLSEIETIVADDCILASNTSSFLITALARGCRERGRVAGMHFFNPVPMMRLVEIVRGAETNESTVDRLVALAETIGHVPVKVSDTPGFLVNFCGRAYTTEAMHILEERAARPEQIDAVMRDCCGFRMGPLELADLTGMDVNYPASLMIREGYGQDPRLRTSFSHRKLFEAGQLGRKVGQGFYCYDSSGLKVDGATGDFRATGHGCETIVLSESDTRLRALAARTGAQLLDRDDGASPILAAPLGEDCSAFAARTGVDASRLVCVDLECDTSRRVTLMTAPGAAGQILDEVAAAFGAAGLQVTAISDSAGFIAQRILTMIANLGCEAAQLGIASPKDIDTAVRSALNYPLGPLEMVDRLDPKRTLLILQRLQALTGDDRYRPSQWLRRRATLGLPIHTT